MKKILFVCTGNTCRSAMAEYIFNYKIFLKKFNNEMQASSAGIAADNETSAADYALAVMKKRGINISGHKSRQIKENIIIEADIIFCMTKGHAEILRKHFSRYSDKIFSVSEYLHNQNDIIDPFGQSLSEYENTANQLSEVCEEIINKLKTEQ